MKLNIIKSKVPEKDGIIWIDSELGLPVIRVSGSINPVNSSSADNFTRISDLDHRLNLMDWGITERIFMDKDNGYLYLNTKLDSGLDYIAKESDLKMNKVYLAGDEKDKKDEEDKQNFEKIYGILMNTKPYSITINDTKTNLSNDYYYSLIQLRDLVSDSSIINVISNGDSKYTSVVNLCNYVPKDYAAPDSGDNYRYFDSSGMADIEVRYTKNEKIYSFSKKLDIFNVSESNLTFPLYQDFINEDVTIEVSSGCIRLFPMTESVTECIISKCYLTINE